MKALFLTSYSRKAASSRVRFFQYAPRLRSLGWTISIHSLLDDSYLKRIYGGRRRSWPAVIGRYWSRVSEIASARDVDVIWMQHQLLPWVPAWIEMRLMANWPPVVVDLDDAIFHRYDQHTSPLIRLSLGSKIGRIMARADIVTAGNEYIAKRAASAGARHVELVPSVVDLTQYKKTRIHRNGSVPVVGWIGTPKTSYYLSMFEIELAGALAASNARMKLVGVKNNPFTSLTPELREWTEQSEAGILAGLDIGVMPLPDLPWERGKCGYKLIQYMAAGVPFVASPVGVNVKLAASGAGLLADTKSEWISHIRRLASDDSLRTQMGHLGRSEVRRSFSLKITTPKVHSILEDAAGRGV